MDNAPSASFFERHEFLLRRLHSLSGLMPLGGYLILHLATNASVLGGAASFQSNVDKIHALGPALPLVEWTFIFIPLIFHTVVGVWIIRSGQPNTGSYPLVGNVRYTLQRVTAWIALVFIFWHVFQMHGWFHNEWWDVNVAQPLDGHQFDPERATSSAALALAPPIIKIIYVIGILSVVFHLANGTWTLGITWGLWVTPQSQKRADYICAGFGVVLAVLGLSALFGMSEVDITEAQAYETARLEESEQFEKKVEDLEREAAVEPADGKTDENRQASESPASTSR